MNESTTIEIRFNSQADAVMSDELALIESIAPDLLRELMQSVDLAEID